MNNIPEDILFKKIIPYISTTSDLQNLKQVDKYFQQNIHCHCKCFCYNCGDEIKGSEKCDTPKCMACCDHVDIKYYTISNDPLCSLNCAIAICDGLIY
jgi:hypothetical protein